MKKKRIDNVKIVTSANTVPVDTVIQLICESVHILLTNEHDDNVA